MIGGYDYEHGANIAGHRGYFLTDVGVALNQSIINYALGFLSKRSYRLLQTPYMMNKNVMAKVAQLSQFDEELYKVCIQLCKTLTLQRNDDTGICLTIFLNEIFVLKVLWR